MSTLEYGRLFLTKMPLFMRRSPEGFLLSAGTVEGTPVVCRTDILMYYEHLQRNHSNTLFLIKIGTMERLTKLLNDSGTIYVVDDMWTPGAFQYYHSKKISKLILNVKFGLPVSPFGTENRSGFLSTQHIHTARYTTAYNRLKLLEHDIFKTVIPNFTYYGNNKIKSNKGDFTNVDKF